MFTLPIVPFDLVCAHFIETTSITVHVWQQSCCLFQFIVLVNFLNKKTFFFFFAHKKFTNGKNRHLDVGKIKLRDNKTGSPKRVAGSKGLEDAGCEPGEAHLEARSSADILLLLLRYIHNCKNKERTSYNMMWITKPDIQKKWSDDPEYLHSRKFANFTRTNTISAFRKWTRIGNNNSLHSI